jgi:UDP-glucose 4-epimerase
VKILLTGGAGYIGNELVYRLSEETSIEEILVYDNLCKGNYNLFTGLRKVPGKNVRFTQGDILDSRSLRSAMRGVDLVIHLAAKVPTPYADQDPHDFEQSNHWGTAEVVYAAEEESVGRFIYLSSQSVYGHGEVKNTEHPRVPTSYYSISKMRGEEHVLRLMEKISVQLVRCANVYGYSKNLRVETEINQLVFDAHFSNRVAIHGDPEFTQTYISLYRLVEVLAQMVNQNVESDVFNLSHLSVSSMDMVEGLKVIYPGLETIFVDQHIPLHDLTMECDRRLAPLLPNDTSIVEDLQKFKELFTF